MQSNGNTVLGGTLLLVAAVGVGFLGLTACGGAKPTGEEAAATPSAEAQAQQAQAEQELQARRERLSEVQKGMSQVRSAASSELPMQDEKLDSILSELDGAASKAEGSLTGEQAEAALNRVEELSRQATERLNTLRRQEQEARVALKEQYDRVVEENQRLPPDLVWGFDGDIYLGYQQSAVEKVQQALKDQGYRSGPVNGNLDETTRVAIARFQEVHGQRVTGIPTPYTRANLGL